MTDTADARLRSKGVFISYRRGETSGQARALHELLSQRFGTAHVFMDVDSIAPGADFVEKIEEAIGSSGVRARAHRTRLAEPWYRPAPSG